MPPSALGWFSQRLLKWVKLRSLSVQLGSPLYPQEQTSPAGPVRSEKCHLQKGTEASSLHPMVQEKVKQAFPQEVHSATVS